ncbi:MAG: XRE family transcriptional regulator [Oscillospiraceae bacterium]|nr:XRE family transcriptional regulator [Oscillospiraceae bacterium]
MTISEQIKVLCVRSNISVAELARRLGTTPQNLNGKLHRDSLTIVDMERIAEATGTRFKREFVLKNGETV